MRHSARLLSGVSGVLERHHLTYPSALSGLETGEKLGGQTVTSTSATKQTLGKLPTPSAIVEALGAYVIGQAQAKRVRMGCDCMLALGCQCMHAAVRLWHYKGQRTLASPIQFAGLGSRYAQPLQTHRQQAKG